MGYIKLFIIFFIIIIISVNNSAIIECDAHYSSPCVTVTIFHPSDFSNMWFILDQDKENGSWTMYDRTTFGHRTLLKRAFIESVIINMSACSFVRDPVWDVFIKVYSERILYTQGELFAMKRLTLPANKLYLHHWCDSGSNVLWLMLHMQKPADAPVYAISFPPL